MITLYTFGPGFGLPDPSPFVMKVATLLKMAKLTVPHRHHGLGKSAEGQAPLRRGRRRGGARIRPSSGGTSRRNIEIRLRPGPRREPAGRSCWGVRENGRGSALLDRGERSLDGRRQFPQGPGASSSSRLPAPLRPLVAAMVRRKLRTPRFTARASHAIRRTKSSRWRRGRSMRSRISSATSRISWAASRPASMPRYSPSCAACCARTSRRAPARSRRGTTICAAMSGA